MNRIRWGTARSYLLIVFMLCGQGSLGFAQDVSLSTADIHIDSGDPFNTSFGFWDSAAGDVNGDGFADYFVTAQNAASNGLTSNGRAYLIYGNDNATPFTMDLISTTSGTVTRFDGLVNFDILGSATTELPDLDGDGYSEFAIAAAAADPLARSGAGVVYLFHGRSDWSDTDVYDLSTFSSTDGTLIIGATSKSIGRSMSHADFNGDGVQDLIIGGSNRAYVVFGSDALPSQIDLQSSLTGVGIDFFSASSGAGFRAEGVGDLDGDGYDEIVITAIFAGLNGTESGAAYIIFGEASPPTSVNLDSIASAAVDSLTVVGAQANDRLGFSVGGVGDINDDGYPDIQLGSVFANRNGGAMTGEAYLIWGDADLRNLDTGCGGVQPCTTIDAGNLGDLGVTFRGPHTGAKVGRAVDGIGDFDNDGIDDLVMGCSGITAEGITATGAAYVLRGGQTLPSLITGTDFDDLLDRHLGTDPFDGAGYFVAGLNDVNGDGAPDFIVTSLFGDTPRNDNSGEAYVIYGDPFTPVQNLACTGSGTEVDLAWDLPANAAYDSIDIMEGNDLIATLAADATSYTITRTSAGLHTYSVVAHVDDASKSKQCEVSITVAAPSALDCSSTGVTVELNWVNGQNYSTAVEVYRDAELAGTLSGGANSFSEGIPEPGVYEYCVRGVNGGDPSADTCCSVVVPQPVFSLSCEADGSTVHLSWSNSEPYDSIRIYRDAALVDVRPGDTTDFNEFGVAPGAHTYAVQTVIAGDLSEQAECAVFVAHMVTALTCASVEDNVHLEWTNGGTYDSVHVSRDGFEIALLDGSDGSFDDAGVAAGAHSYSVSAEESGSVSDPAECEVLVISPVSGLVCGALDNDVSLNWTSDIDAPYTSIKIFRNDLEVAVLSGDASSYTDLDLAAGDYDYDVVALVETGFTSSASAACLVAVLDAPGDLSCVAGAGSVELVWSPRSNYEGVQVSRDGGVIATLPGTAEGYTDTPAAGTHFYEVVGIAGSSESAAATCEVTSSGDPFGLECSVDGDAALLSWQNGGAYDEVQVAVDGLVVLELPGASQEAEVTLTGEGDHTVCVRGVIGAGTSNPACCEVRVLAPVDDLSCVGVGDSVFLTWTNGKEYDEVQISRDDEVIAHLPGTFVSYSDTAVALGPHLYGVRGLSGESLSVATTCEATAYAPIVDLTCTAAGGHASLSFTPPAGLDSIEIERDGLLIATLAGDASEFEDSPLSAGVYEYTVTGFGSGGGTAPVVCTVHLPFAPANLFCTLPDGVSPVLGWENNELVDALEISRDGILVATLPGTASSFTDEPQFPGEYLYEVVSVINPDQRSESASCTIVVLSAPGSFACAAVDGGVQLEWQNLDTYSSVVIRRNGAELATEPGTTDSFFDVFSVVGTHNYEIAGSRDGFLSPFVSCEVTIPEAVSGLSCSFALSAGELSWTNEDAYTSIRILRNGGLLDELAGDATAYVDPVLAAGHYEYSVIGVLGVNHASAASCTIDVLLQPEDFACVVHGASAELSWVNAEPYESIEVLLDGIVIATLDGSETAYTAGIPDAVNHTYCVRGLSGSGLSALACCAVQSLVSPHDLVCTVQGDSADLSWTNLGSYDSIEIRRDGDLVVSLGGEAVSFHVTGLPAGGHVFSVIGHSGPNTSEAATCDVLIVSTVEALQCSAEGGTAHLAWSLGSPSYDAIRIVRSGTEVALLDGSSTSYDDSPPGAGSYTYEVVAIEAGNDSEAASCDIEILAVITGIDCSAAGSDVFLHWTNGQSYEAIEIARDGSPIATIDGSATSYTDTDVPGGSHEYSLVASLGASEASSVGCEVTVLDPIVDLSCVSDESQVTLSWTNGAAYVSIVITRNGNPLATLDGSDSSYVDTTAPGVYVYALVGVSGDSQSAAATCEVTEAGAPSELVCSALAGDLSLSWTNGGSYDNVRIFLDGDLVQTLSGGSTSATLHGVSAGSHEACVAGVVSGNQSASACCAVEVLEPITGFECSSTGDDVHLSWNNGGTYATIEIVRDSATLAVISGALESYVDAGVSAGSHIYEISATSDSSTTASADCSVAVLAGIGTLTCTAERGTAVLSFAAAGTYDSIQVTRDGDLIAILAGTASNYSDAGISSLSIEYCVVGVTGDSSTDPSCCTVDAPEAPEDLTCTLSGGDDVELNWVNTQAGDSISIERNGVAIASLSGSANTFTDSGVAPGEYEYCVINVIGDSESLAACCGATAPFPPFALTCVSTAAGVVLSWENGQSYGGVQIRRDGVLIDELSGSAETFTDTHADPGERDYEVRGVVGGSPSGAATCSVTVANPVQSLTCENTDSGIELSWLVPAGLDQVAIYRNGVLLATLGGSATSYLDDSAGAGEYTYKVYGIDAGEYSPAAQCSIRVLEGVEDLTCCATDGLVEICWTSPVDYSSISVYRNGVLAATLSGSATCYEESRMPGTFDYEVIGADGGASSVFAGCTVEVAGAINGFACELLKGDCASSDVLLSWSLTDPFDSVEVYRDGSLIATVSGQAEEFTDLNAGADHTYEVVGILSGDLCGATASGECSTELSNTQFLRADSNGDGDLDIGDAIKTLYFLFLNGQAPPCLDAADADDNGAVSLSDPIYTLNYIFMRGSPPPAPFPREGVDETCDTLDCDL